MLGTMPDGDITCTDSVRKPEITVINVSRLRASGCAAIGRKLDSALVVLFQDCTSDVVALGFHKHLGSDCIRHVVTSTQDFSLGGAFGV